ncbi:13143_t:CDS:2 [Rhizophagus irregularis]|nr:13143_t:CDS:2 [Rhizophagus irregularis]
MNTNLLPCILIDYLDISNSNAENSIQAISIKLSVIINKNEPPTKKPRQARCETKSKEKRLLEPLVTCSEYLNNKQIEEVEKY